MSGQNEGREGERDLQAWLEGYEQFSENARVVARTAWYGSDGYWVEDKLLCLAGVCAFEPFDCGDGGEVTRMGRLQEPVDAERTFFNWLVSDGMLAGGEGSRDIIFALDSTSLDGSEVARITACLFPVGGIVFINGSPWLRIDSELQRCDVHSEVRVDRSKVKSMTALFYPDDSRSRMARPDGEQSIIIAEQVDEKVAFNHGLDTLLELGAKAQDRNHINIPDVVVAQMIDRTLRVGIIVPQSASGVIARSFRCERLDVPEASCQLDGSIVGFEGLAVSEELRFAVAKAQRDVATRIRGDWA